MTRRGVRLVLASVLLSSACNVHETVPPPLTGPSELALSLSMAASPDHVTQDGSSTATIAVIAREINGKPISNVELRFDIVVNNQAPTSAACRPRRRLPTDRDARRSSTRRPPLRRSRRAGRRRVVTITAEPVGTNFSTSNVLDRQVELLVAPPPPPPPVAGAPTASVTFSPASPKVGQIVTFNAASSAAQAGHQIMDWYWEFGDSLANDEHGNDASHVYRPPAPSTWCSRSGTISGAGQHLQDDHRRSVRLGAARPAGHLWLKRTHR